MSTITDIIRKEIENLSTDATRTNVGVITTLADGVARVSGLSKVMFNEMIEFPNNVVTLITYHRALLTYPCWDTSSASMKFMNEETSISYTISRQIHEILYSKNKVH